MNVNDNMNMNMKMKMIYFSSYLLSENTTDTIEIMCLYCLYVFVAALTLK